LRSNSAISLAVLPQSVVTEVAGSREGIRALLGRPDHQPHLAVSAASRRPLS
jgi:hypothetical protein